MRILKKLLNISVFLPIILIAQDMGNFDDFDKDFILNINDIDDDNDGVPDNIEGLTDFDNDSFPNKFDLDSDNDGCSDAFESGSTTSILYNFQFPSLSGNGTNGLYNTLETSIDNGIINYFSTYNLFALDSTVANCCNINLNSSASNITSSPVSTCFPANDGKITISGTGLEPNTTYFITYTYNGIADTISPNISTNSSSILILSNLLAGNYKNIKIQDANNSKCYSELNSAEEVIVPNYVPPSMNVSFEPKNPRKSQNCADGSIIVKVTGVNSPYIYSWNTGQTEDTLTNLNAQNYKLTVTDSKGCNGNSPYTLELLCDNDCDALPNDSTVDVLCKNDETGFANVIASSFNHPASTFTFVWYDYNYTFIKRDSGKLNSTLDSLKAGNYNIKIYIDSTYCSAVTKVINISEPNQTLTANAFTITHQETVNGNQGVISMVATGGTSPYYIHWDSIFSVDSIIQTVSGLMPNNYCVKVTDKNQCISDSSCTIINKFNCNEYPNINIIKKDITCYGFGNGEINMNITDGKSPYNIYVNNSLSLLNNNNLTKGKYIIKVIDSLGCISIDSAIINEPDTINYSINSNYIKCNGDSTGSIDLEVIGGNAPYTYTWNNGIITQDISNIKSGEYICTIKDSKNCTVIAKDTIYQTSSKLTTNIEVFDETDTLANDGKVIIHTNGGYDTLEYLYSYQIGITIVNTNDTILTNLKPGIYTLITYDDYNCMFINNFIIEKANLSKDTINLILSENNDINTCIDISELPYNVDTIKVCEEFDNIDIQYSNNSNCITLSPNNNFVGNDTMCIILCDSANYCDTTIIIVKVNPSKDTIDSIEIHEKDSIILCIDTNDLTTVIDTIYLCEYNENIIVTIDSISNCIEINPNENYYGYDTICIIICDTNDFCDTSIINIKVIPNIDTISLYIIEDSSIVHCIDTSDFVNDTNLYSNECITNSQVNIYINTDSINCILINSIPEYFGIDTMCITICNDDNICDTTIIITNYIPVKDTIKDTIFVGDNIDFCNVIYTSNNIIDSVYNTDTNSENTTIGIINNCISIIANSIGNDTIVTIECNGLLCDTTIIILYIDIHPELKLNCSDIINDTTESYDCEYIIGNLTQYVTYEYNRIDSTEINYIQNPDSGTKITLDNEKVLVTVKYYDLDSNEYSCDFEIFVHCNDEILIREFITPNNDNINDNWEILGLSKFPNNKVKLFNRYGNKVFEANNYQNDWYGKLDPKDKYPAYRTSNGILPQGTYYYIIDLGVEDKKPFTGYLHLKL